jgi:hypothetical protein
MGVGIRQTLIPVETRNVEIPNHNNPNEELHNLYSSPNIIRMIKSMRMRWSGLVARMGETKNAYRLLVEKPERRRPLGRPRHRWVDNIKMDSRNLGWDGVDWIELAQDREQWRALLVNTVINLRVPKNYWEFPECLHNWQLLRKDSAR